MHGRELDPPNCDEASTVSGLVARGKGRFWAVFALLLSCVAVAGCHSTPEAQEGILSSVVLRGNTPGQIAQVTTEVFRKHDYEVSEAGLNRLMFEKKGSAMNSLAYGSWFPDEPVWVRVRASIVPTGEQTFRLQCSGWLVKDRGGATEEEIKIRHMHHRPYDELLGEVAARLGGNVAAPH